MKVIDPNEELKRKKAPAKLKGGEDFVAEPGELKPTEGWKDAQMALLKLTLKTDKGYGNYLPQMDAYQSGGWGGEYIWDPKTQGYYHKAFVSFKISYRYYKGQKRRSYLFWPKHATPTYIVKEILKANSDQTFKLVTETGTAEYAYLGHHESTDVDYYGTRRKIEVMALWRSTGTMKPRRKNERHVSWESDARTSN